MGYNPLNNGSPGSLSARIIAALDMPMDGNAGYYTAVQSQALTKILEWVSWESKERGLPPISLQDVTRLMDNTKALAKIWKEVAGTQLPQDTEQNLKGLGARMSRLVEGSNVISRLNVNDGISIPQIMQEGNVIYFNLESNANPALATAVGRMLMFDIREACSLRSEESTPFHLIIDEFQDVACDSLSDLIAKIRSAMVPLTLATQSLAQIANVSEEFMNTVLSVTAINIAMQQKNPDEIDLFSRMSGSIRYTERQESIADGMDQGDDDEKRHESGFAMEYTTAGRLAANRTFAIDPNIFLSMKEGTAVVFARGALAKICCFGYATNKWDMEALFESVVQPKIAQEGVLSDSQEDVPPWKRISSHPVVREILDGSHTQKKSDSEKYAFLNNLSAAKPLTEKQETRNSQATPESAEKTKSQKQERPEEQKGHAGQGPHEKAEQGASITHSEKKTPQEETPQKPGEHTEREKSKEGKEHKEHKEHKERKKPAKSKSRDSSLASLLDNASAKKQKGNTEHPEKELSAVSAETKEQEPSSPEGNQEKTQPEKEDGKDGGNKDQHSGNEEKPRKRRKITMMG